MRESHLTWFPPYVFDVEAILISVLDGSNFLLVKSDMTKSQKAVSSGTRATWRNALKLGARTDY